MKTTHTIQLLVVLLALAVGLTAQTTPEALLSQLPGIPTASCTADTWEMNRFSEQIYTVKAAIQDEIDRIHADAQATLTPATVKIPASAAGIGNAKKLMELATEQTALGERIAERMQRIAGIFKEVEDRDTIETRILLVKTRPLEKLLCSGICSKAEIARSNAAEKQIYELNVKYCQLMSPLQTEAISQYLTTVKTLLPEYRKLSVLQNQFAGLQQLGEPVPENLSGLAAVDEYASVLLTAYKYTVGKFNQ